MTVNQTEATQQSTKIKYAAPLKHYSSVAEAIIYHKSLITVGMTDILSPV